jgi:aminotransferase in exopolysaccharide biosynthesis
MKRQFQEIVDFVRKLYNQPEGFIPLHAPVFNGNEKKYLEECIDSTFVSSVGKFVDEFEFKMAEYTGAKKVVACVNGTNALHLALKLVGVESGSEVITQPLTFIATANAISYCGAKPVFLDVDIDTMGLSPESLKHWLEDNVTLDSKTNQPINQSTNQPISACVPMHTFGFPCRIDETVEICNEYNIPVVEDAAESLGSFFKNRHTGTFGEIGVLSFNGNKVITTGGGGMLLFNDVNLAKRARHLTTQAKVPHPWEFIHDEIGYNYRMPNINAALGLAQLEQLPEFLKKKQKIALAYQTFFQTINPINFINPINHSLSNFWLNCILLPNEAERDAFLKYSNENGVMTRPTWKLMNELEMFKDCETGAINNAKMLAERLVNIPSSTIISDEE